MFNTTKIIWGLGIILAVVLIVSLDKFFVNFIVFSVLFYLALDEARKLFSLENTSIIPPMLAFFVGVLSEKALFCGVLALILVLGFLVYKKAENLNSALLYLYPTLPLLTLWQLYLKEGIFAVFWLIVIVASCDSGAYFAGKLIGKIPFSQTSPNKTLEGVIGGVIFALIVGSIVGSFVYDFWLSFFCSLVAAVFAVIGDLLESYFKRVAGVKDSGDLIPGHGGILDRIDAMLIAVFAMVVFL